MSRRDTIIIAVLLNAGLLIVLFATSLKSETTEVVEPQSVVVAVEPAKAAQPAVFTDEVDQALKQYTPPVITQEAKPSFAAELAAMGSLEPQNPVAAPVSALAVLSPESSTALKEIRVKKGDVLERIARRNHVSVEDLMKCNNLSSTRLKIGQVLKIPEGGKVSSAASQGESGEKYYVVKNGDNPWTIAVKNHIKVEDLLKLNNLDESQARRLKPGDKLRIK